jgi:hypothetical protein
MEEVGDDKKGQEREGRARDVDVSSPGTIFFYFLSSSY